MCTACRFALLAPPPRVSAQGVAAAVAFTGRARNVVLGLKYRNRRQVARHLAGLVVNSIVANGDHLDLDLVTWAPTSAARRRSRGFDQGELLAGLVARQLGVPSRSLLRRTVGSHNQTGRSRRERLGGVSFQARPGLLGRRILVIDDVVTTGATLSAAREALEHVGAAHVGLYAAAATPSGLVSASRTPNRSREATTRDVAA